MQTCFFCGEEIDVQQSDQFAVPMHAHASCSYRKVRDLKALRNFYHRSRCPKCSREAYYLRHGGGSVWLSSIRHPWPKHTCVEVKARGGKHASAFAMAADLDDSYVLGCVLDIRQGRGKSDLLIKTETLSMAHIVVLAGGELGALKDDILFFSERAKECRYSHTFLDLRGKKASAIARRKIQSVVWLKIE